MTGVLNSLIALIPFVLLLIPSERTDGFFNPTDRSVTVRFRGFFALLVILHHMAQRVTDKGLLWIYFDTGFLAVAMFFFYSGYGLMKKGIAQKNGFFRRRLPSHLIPYILTLIIYWIIYALTGDVKSFSSLLMEHFNNASGISFLWYVFAYLSWVLVLGAALQFMKKDIQIMYTAVIYALGYVAFGVLAIPKYFWIYDTIILIPLGCAWAHYEEKILSLIRNHYRPVLIVSLAVFLLSFIGHMLPVLRVPAYMVSAVSFMIFLNTAAMKRRPSGKTIAFLGGISYELYVLHGIPVTFLRDVMGNEALWTLAVLVTAVLSAWCMNAIARRTWKKPVAGRVR